MPIETRKITICLPYSSTTNGITDNKLIKETLFFFSMTIQAKEALSITSLTVWAMVIFLILLVGGLGFALIKELRKRDRKQLMNPKVRERKGF